MDRKRIHDCLYFCLYNNNMTSNSKATTTPPPQMTSDPSLFRFSILILRFQIPNSKLKTPFARGAPFGADPPHCLWMPHRHRHRPCADRSEGQSARATGGTGATPAMESMSSSPVAMFRIDGERLKNLIEQTAPKSVLIFGTGPFQRRVLAGTVLCLLVVALHNTVLMVLARPVAHWCRRPDELLNVPLDEWKNASLPRLPDGSASECTRYEPALPPFPPQDPTSSALVNRTEVPCDAWEYDLSAGGPTIESQWDLVCSRRRPVLLALAASYLLGGVVVMPMAGHYADRVGRRPVLCAAVVVLALSSLATCLVRSLYAFVALRVVTGAASSVAEVTSTLILFEVCRREGPNHTYAPRRAYA
nr:solute carrier family 22 member 7-like [Dermacentor andersoni]